MYLSTICCKLEPVFVWKMGSSLIQVGTKYYLNRNSVKYVNILVHIIIISYYY